MNVNEADQLDRIEKLLIKMDEKIEKLEKWVNKLRKMAEGFGLE